MFHSKEGYFFTICCIYFLIGIQNVVLQKNDIFSIISDTILQRKIEYRINNVSTSNGSWNNQDDFLRRLGQKFTQYVSLISEESNELLRINEQKKNEDSLRLSDMHLSLPLSDDDPKLEEDLKLHGVSYDDFTNFKKSTVGLETVIPDASKPNVFKINYETKINAIVLSGSAEINGTNFDFVLNITEPILQEEYERVKGTDFKIKTKSILQTFTFKTFDLFIILPEKNVKIESPNKRLLQRLADTWLVQITNAVDDRFVVPQVIKQSELFSETYKQNLMDEICSLIKKQKVSDDVSIPDYTEKDMLPIESSNRYSSYEFSNTKLENIKTFTNCEGNSFTVRVKNNKCENDLFFLHNIIFVFTYPLPQRSSSSTLNWSFRKQMTNHYNYDSSESTEINTESISLVSVQISIVSDKDGEKIKKVSNVKVDLETEKTNSVSKDYYRDILIKHVYGYISNQIKSSFDNILN